MSKFTAGEVWQAQHRWQHQQYVETVAQLVQSHARTHARAIAAVTRTTGPLVGLRTTLNSALQQPEPPAPAELSHPSNLYFYTDSDLPAVPQGSLRSRQRYWRRCGHPAVAAALGVAPPRRPQVLMGLDPGTANHGYWVGCVRSRNVLRAVEHLASGIFPHTIRDLNAGVEGTARAYTLQLQQYIAAYGVEHIVVERFMSRGFGGDLIEKVGVMIGCVLAAAASTPPYPQVKIISSAIWKNRCNAIFDLREVYARTPAEPHQIDSALMALMALPLAQPYAYFGTHLEQWLEYWQ